jgi:hypothetical protein
MKTGRLLAGLALLHAGNSVAADLNWKLGDLEFLLSGQLAVGAAWRMDKPNLDLLGKLNVPGQQDLCPDGCMSTSGDLEPNQRLVDARGSFSGANGDNGNLNYQQYDLVAAVARISPELIVDWGSVLFKFNGIGYFDPVNTGFEETHTDTHYQPARTPRPQHIEEDYARGYKLREAFVAFELPVSDTPWTLSVGSQVIRWGESNLTLANTLNEVSPPDATVARAPGFTVSEAFQPIPAITLAGNLGGAWSFEALYQLRWVGVQPDPVGSFFSTNDLIGGGRYLMTGLGQYSEDPDRQYVPAGTTALLSSATRTIYGLPEAVGEPRDSGQFGLQLKYFASDFNDGTEFGFYYLHYHSRLPHLSVYAAQESCTRQAVTNDFAAVLLACQGFNSPANPVGLEPLPTDTEQPFVEYPEDIDLFGLSFNTNLGDWSFFGEYAYRPNMPLQVHGTDVLFASIAPGLPEEDIAIPASFGGTALVTMPGHRRLAPDFLSLYRGLPEYGPGEKIEGYERFAVGQLALGGIRSFGPGNPLGADQILLVLEAGLTHIVDLPPLSSLQLEGHGDRTHYSPGADGSGDPTGTADSLRVNPTQQTTGFATELSAGYRLICRVSYNQVLGDYALHPTLGFFHDVYGVSPATIDNYVRGRMFIVPGIDVELGRSLNLGIQYQVFTGADDLNRRSDRDNLALSLRYSF